MGLARLFDEKEVLRVTTLASPELLCRALDERFGAADWDDACVARMKPLMLADLHDGVSDEYSTAESIAVLYYRAGGEVTHEMRERLGQYTKGGLLAELRRVWDRASPSGRAADSLSFADFYEALMGRYFASPSAPDTKACLRLLDSSGDGMMQFDEIAWLAAAAVRLHRPPDLAALVDAVFARMLLPMLKSRGGSGGSANRVDYTARGGGALCGTDTTTPRRARHGVSPSPARRRQPSPQ